MKVTTCADGLSCSQQGYFLAAYLYMTIVFVLPLAAGVFARATDLPVSVDEAYAGLILPASAYVIMGKSGKEDVPTLHRPQLQGAQGTEARGMHAPVGAVLEIIICFMADTSSGASEMLALSSLFTFDVYRRYINPKARATGLHKHAQAACRRCML